MTRALALRTDYCAARHCSLCAPLDSLRSPILLHACRPEQFADLCAMSDSECKPIERLYEVTFRKPVKVDAS